MQVNKRIRKSTFKTGANKVPVFTGEFWTARQRQGANLHEIAYRACFKPALPNYFIAKYSKPGDIIYDPFGGRGTTVVEAALMGRRIIVNDVNPLSRILIEGRLVLPELSDLEKRLDEILATSSVKEQHRLSMFYHPATLKELLKIRNWLIHRKASGREDAVDKWIRMVTTNRLTGHSRGFFSVYTLPPNQAVTRHRQIKINHERNQQPEYRNTRELILKKSKSLMRYLTDEQKDNIHQAAKSALYLNKDARFTKAIKSNSVHLTVTSPPFLDVVQYANDNWLRCWFNHIDADAVQQQITMSKTTEDWEKVMQQVIRELYRITAKGGHVAFEVGEVRYGKIKLEEYVVPMGIKAGFVCDRIIINAQQFTKTANIWGIKNNLHGTNSNRIVIFSKQ